MNETLWFTGTDPLALLDALYPMRSLGSEPPQARASRLYLLACARKQWDRLPGVCRALVTLAEVFADAPREQSRLRGQVAPVAERLMQSDGEPEDLHEAVVELAFCQHISPDLAAAWAAASEPPDESFDLKPGSDEWRGLAALVYLPFERNTPAYRWVPAQVHSVELLREVYGNPYRRIDLKPEWLTDTAVVLARQMYEARDFGAMPILADALQDAGCDNDDILTHCRDSKPVHVRGCWVVDQVLQLR
jgi:hypothetical protein